MHYGKSKYISWLCSSNMCKSILHVNNEHDSKLSFKFFSHGGERSRDQEEQSKDRADRNGDQEGAKHISRRVKHRSKRTKQDAVGKHLTYQHSPRSDP